MDREALTRRLMTTFLGEVDEHVQTINQLTLEMERAPVDAVPKIRDLFRSVHSLKGAARAVGVSLIESSSHQLETLLGRVRDEGRAPTPDEFQVILAFADAVEDAAGRLRRGEPLLDAPLARFAPSAAPPPHTRAITNSLPPLPPPPTVAANPSASAAPALVRAAPSPGETTTGGEVTTPGGGLHDDTIRVDVTKLDDLLAQCGELIVTRARLAEQIARLNAELEALGELRVTLADPRRHGPDPGARGRRPDASYDDRLAAIETRLDDVRRQLDREVRGLGHAARVLDESVRKTRLVPFAEACQPLERTLRDVVRATGKDATLVVEGGAVELDRQIVRALKDPLIHLVRNAADHGIELPEVRRARGKPPRGTVTVRATMSGHDVEIAVTDDGGGVDREEILQRAQALALPVSRDDRSLERVLFAPGFSTARRITAVSGRGVGLDVVQSAVDRLHGAVDVESTPGHGFCTSIRVPLALTTLRALVIEAMGQSFAVPLQHLQRLLRVSLDSLSMMGGRPVFTLDGDVLPVIDLAAVLGRPSNRRGSNQLPALVVVVGKRRLLLLVDALVNEQEVVLKAPGRRLLRLRHFIGVARLADGRIVLVLDMPEVLDAALESTSTVPTRAAPPTAPAAPRRILVVDDSVTTRTLIKTVLEAAGYAVTVAFDGLDAWQRLQTDGADLVVSDVEMPRMDGFVLTETLRRTERFRRTPVVLVTGLGSDRDRLRGLTAGASAYLAKSAFDHQTLLDTVAGLL